MVMKTPAYFLISYKFELMDSKIIEFNLTVVELILV